MTIGNGVKRIEDERLIMGTGEYVGDLYFPEQLEAVIIRSQHAYAKIKTIKAETAREISGVHAIITAADLPVDLEPIPMRLAPEESLKLALQYPLAKDIVRYVGEPIAVVVAKNRYVAEDAADLIQIKYEPLEPVTEVFQAVHPEASTLHESIGKNDLYVIESEKGNLNDYLNQCDFIVEDEFYVQRHTGIPLETRGLVARPEVDQSGLLVYGAAKVVHFNHQVLANLLNMDPDKIRLIENDVGGGFGVRGEFYPEDYLIPFLALKLKKPVRWIEDRLEHMKTTNHSREQKHRVKVGFKQDGRILAFSDEIYVDMGAYIRTHGVTVPELTQGMIPGPYDFPSIKLTTHVVATNKTPTGTYRGPGRFESTFVRERVIDLVADKLELDPALVRERNLINNKDFPFTNGIKALGQEIELDSGDYTGILNRSKLGVNWNQFKEKQMEAADQGRLLGIGMAMFVEKSGLGPWEFCEVEITSKGEVICKSGLTDVGQGVKTMLAQVCSDQLGVPYDQIKITHGDTKQVEKGVGSFATRGTVVGGTAAWYAAKKIKDKLLKVASEHLNKPLEELTLLNNHMCHARTNRQLISLQGLVELCYEKQIKLAEKHTFEIDHMTYPYGVHIAEVEINPETGKITIPNYYIGYDVGKSVNPVLVKGQIVGGMAQGLGGTMFEELKYDDAGQLVTGTFMDYLIPTAEEVPEINVEILEDAPSPLNPLGLKGAGEGGTVAVAPAIANAIADALGKDSKAFNLLPIRPETVMNALKERKRARFPEVKK